MSDTLPTFALSADLCIARLSATTAEEVVRALAGLLARLGHVKPSFEAAALLRERRSPTGLPFPGVGVAMPHAEPEHVTSPALAIASLAKPVSFRQMGSPAIKLDVGLVVMPALTTKEQAGAGLAKLIELLQDEALRTALVAAESGEQMCAAIRARWDEQTSNAGA